MQGAYHVIKDDLRCTPIFPRLCTSTTRVLAVMECGFFCLNKMVFLRVEQVVFSRLTSSFCLL